MSLHGQTRRPEDSREPLPHLPDPADCPHRPYLAHPFTSGNRDTHPRYSPDGATLAFPRGGTPREGASTGLASARGQRRSRAVDQPSQRCAGVCVGSGLYRAGSCSNRSTRRQWGRIQFPGWPSLPPARRRCAPGPREHLSQILTALDTQQADDVVEFGPGLGSCPHKDTSPRGLADMCSPCEITVYSPQCHPGPQTGAIATTEGIWRPGFPGLEGCPMLFTGTAGIDHANSGRSPEDRHWRSGPRYSSLSSLAPELTPVTHAYRTGPEGRDQPLASDLPGQAAVDHHQGLGSPRLLSGQGGIVETVFSILSLLTVQNHSLTTRDFFRNFAQFYALG